MAANHLNSADRYTYMLGGYMYMFVDLGKQISMSVANEVGVHRSSKENTCGLGT